MMLCIPQFLLYLQAQLVLVLASLGKQHLTITLLFFGISHPPNLLISFLPSPLSFLCFPCVGPVEALIGDTQRRNQGQVFAADPSAHLTCISVSHALREKLSRKGIWRFWITLSYRWGNWGPERYGDFAEILTPLCSRAATQTLTTSVCIQKHQEPMDKFQGTLDQTYLFPFLK